MTCPYPWAGARTRSPACSVRDCDCVGPFPGRRARLRAACLPTRTLLRVFLTRACVRAASPGRPWWRRQDEVAKWVDTVWASQTVACDVWRVDVAVRAGPKGAPSGAIIMARNGKELQLSSPTLSLNMLNYCGYVLWRRPPLLGAPNGPCCLPTCFHALRCCAAGCPLLLRQHRLRRPAVVHGGDEPCGLPLAEPHAVPLHRPAERAQVRLVAGLLLCAATCTRRSPLTHARVACTHTHTHTHGVLKRGYDVPCPSGSCPTCQTRWTAWRCRALARTCTAALAPPRASSS
jgi:hypothetical protein